MEYLIKICCFFGDASLDLAYLYQKYAVRFYERSSEDVFGIILNKINIF